MKYTLTLEVANKDDAEKYDRIIQSDNWDLIDKTFWLIIRSLENAPISNFILTVQKEGRSILFVERSL